MGMGRFFHDNKIALCGVGIASGIPMTMISVMSLMYSDGDTGMIQWSYDTVGSWAFWLILPGLALLVIGGYYIFDFFKRLKEFNSLMKSESKAKFIKNIDKIEELAWRLHPKYERIVIARKKKYRIK